MGFKVRTDPIPDACSTCGDPFWDCAACGCATCACGHLCLVGVEGEGGEGDILDLLADYLEEYEIPESIKERGRNDD